MMGEIVDTNYVLMPPAGADVGIEVDGDEATIRNKLRGDARQ